LAHDLHHRLRAHREQLGLPRHAQWDRLGLMSVRSTIHGQLEALAEVEEHPFQEGSEAGTNLPQLAGAMGQHVKTKVLPEAKCAAGSNQCLDVNKEQGTKSRQSTRKNARG
jgi:hypothetical protein